MARLTGESELEALVTRSRNLGADRSLVLHGGGNTSTKLLEADHRGQERRVLRIKASGRDLATARAADFPGLWLDELLPLREREAISDEEMLGYLARCLVEPDAARPSIETLLHAFIPARHVDHVHADAICALANAPDPAAAVREVLGDDIAVVGYRRPGFALAREVAAAAEGARAVVLAHHGLVTWADSHEDCSGLTLALVEQARAWLGPALPAPGVGGQPADPDGPGGDDRAGGEIERFLVRLRGAVSKGRRRVLALDPGAQPLLEGSDLESLAALRATPDHVLRIGPRSCLVRLSDDPGEAIERYRAAYDGYHRRQAGPDGPGPLDDTPRVLLVPGLGCIAAAPGRGAARTALEVAAHTHAAVASTLQRFGSASWLDERELFEFEYWPLELYKLTLAPPPRELSGRVAIVTGAASGIGRAIALDLAARGAELVLADLDGAGLEATADGLEGAVTMEGDLTDQSVIDALGSAAVASFGGLDAVVFAAGIASTGRLEELEPEQWRRSLEVNLTAQFRLTRRVWPLLREQGLGGSLVYVASKNAFAPGAGFGAYSVAKAGLIQLARIAALEGGEAGIRANAVNPDAVFAGSNLWSEQVRRERAQAHGVELDDLERFYASRSLLGREVSVADVAEAVAFLVSDRSQATTGSVIPVDGGVVGAFPR